MDSVGCHPPLDSNPVAESAGELSSGWCWNLGSGEKTKRRMNKGKGDGERVAATGNSGQHLHQGISSFPGGDHLGPVYCNWVGKLVRLNNKCIRCIWL